VLAMLLRKKKITRELIRMLDGWRHSGFNVFAGGRIQPREKKSLENLAAYLIRATFSQKRMEYCPEQATVVYRSPGPFAPWAPTANRGLLLTAPGSGGRGLLPGPASTLGLLNYPGGHDVFLLLSHPSVQFQYVRPGFLLSFRSDPSRPPGCSSPLGLPRITQTQHLVCPFS
jgi:hypothetical protein